MPFKIVQTIETGKMVLTCVPHQWEINGILYWPNKHPYKLQKDESSQPDQTWNQLNCVVKRRNIKSYQDAENEIDIMSNNSETEPDAEHVSATKRRKFIDVPQLSYNIMAEEILKSDKQNASSTIMLQGENDDANKLYKEVAVTNQVSHIFTEQMPVVSNEIAIPAASISSDMLVDASKENVERYVVIPQNNELDSSLIYSYIEKETSSSEGQCNLTSLENNIKTIKSDIKCINDDIKVMVEKLNITLYNQAQMEEKLNKTLLEVAKIQVKNEEFLKKTMSEKRSHALGLKLIKDVKDLYEFEKQLIDIDYREELKRNFNMLCNRGIGQGTTSAYAMVDLVFERQFFKSCSWAGGSRKPNEPEKICFKSFSETINFFFDTIHQFDSSFNLTDCHKFFKTILRNANQRSNHEPQRSSTKKNRGKTTDKNISTENIVTYQNAIRATPIDEHNGGKQNEAEDIEEILDLK